jgi:hypothetical protein
MDAEAMEVTSRSVRGNPTYSSHRQHAEQMVELGHPEQQSEPTLGKAGGISLWL